MRALSKLGLCSRAQAEGWVAEGRVRVNGRVATDARRWVSTTADRIEVSGAAPTPRPESKRYYALHKPRGFVTTRSDERGRKTVYDLLPPEVASRWLFPVGRLDRDSEGLLLFSDDGPWADALTSPEGHVEKAYRVAVDRAPTAEELDRLRTGIRLDGVPTRPARIERGADGWFDVILTEGRNRQIRRMFEAVGSKVVRLVRVRIGPLELGTLAPGECRPLSSSEVRALRR